MSERTSARQLFRIYSALALSWLFMSLEQPIASRIINGFPDSTLNLAALVFVMSVSLIIESPVIDLLSTSTALSRNPKNIDRIAKFCLVLCLGVTAIHALVVFTPIYELVVYNLLQQPKAIAEAARVPLMIMTPWSAFIGWRRFNQGLIIRNQQTKAIGIGTLGRVLTVAGVCYGAAAYLKLHPLTAAAIGLVVSVIVEAVIVSIAAVPAKAALYLLDSGDQKLASYKDIIKFHVPQTLTTLVVMSTGTVTLRALAMTQDQVLNQAAWGQAANLMWLLRSVTYALPEVVIANGEHSENQPILSKFCSAVGLTMTAIAMLVGLTPVGAFVFRNILSCEPHLLAPAALGLAATSFLPFVNARMSYARGLLTMAHKTQSRLWAILCGVAFQIIGLGTALALKLPGVLIAASGIVLGQLAEWAVLHYAWHTVKQKTSQLPQVQHATIEP